MHVHVQSPAPEDDGAYNTHNARDYRDLYPEAKIAHTHIHVHASVHVALTYI